MTSLLAPAAGAEVTPPPPQPHAGWDASPLHFTLSILSGCVNNSQPRSQGLSSLPPLVVGRKTLVAAGHMATQNLGGKKICWVEGVAGYFVWLM